VRGGGRVHGRTIDSRITPLQKALPLALLYGRGGGDWGDTARPLGRAESHGGEGCADGALLVGSEGRRHG
jgi:hypothetical protein